MAKVQKNTVKPLVLPRRFKPRCWSDTDGRYGAIRILKQRYEKLKEESKADTTHKDLICQRAAFLSVQLETMEVVAAETGELNLQAHVQMTNTLSGLLKALGVKPKAKKRSLHKLLAEEDS